MAVSSSTFSNIGGAVSDIFAGFGAADQASLKAKGLNLDAQGDRIKAQGDLAEASNYDLASTLAGQNAQFTQTSTAIKQAQLDRQLTQTIGGERADIAGAGFSGGGSSIDLLRDSASQGALTKAVAGQQGLITEAGYKEQQQSYTTLATAGRAAAAGENNIADQTDQLAQQTLDAGKTSEIGDFISGAIKGVAAVASVVAAPATGGLSLAAMGGLFMGGGSPSGY